MAFHRRGSIISAAVSEANSINSQIDSALNSTPTSTSETASSTKSAQTTTSSIPSTTSAKATSTAISTASSTIKSTAAASSSTDSAAASTITSTSSTASSSITSTSSSSSSSSPSPTSSRTPTSTLIATTTSTPAPTSTVLPSSSSTSGNQISTAGVAVAAVFAVLIIAGIVYLLWKYLPACRRRRERSYQSRSHRDGLPYAGPRKGLAFTDEESSELHLDDPQLGLGLRKYDFHTAPTYYPGQSRDADGDLSQHRPLTSVSEEYDIVSPLSTRSVRSQFSQSMLPSALQAGTPIYPFPQQFQYQDVRASQIGVAVGSASVRSVYEMQREGNERPGSGNSREKGLPPLPLPSMGYGKAFP